MFFSVRASSEKLCKLVDFTMQLATISVPFYHDFQHFFGIYLQIFFPLHFLDFRTHFGAPLVPGSSFGAPLSALKMTFGGGRFPLDGVLDPFGAPFATQNTPWTDSSNLLSILAPIWVPFLYDLCMFLHRFFLYRFGIGSESMFDHMIIVCLFY